MITLEKLLLLKSVPLFNQVPDDILLHVVTSIVKEQTAEAGEQILAKGSYNPYMYIIVSGRVKVHEEDMLITRLGEREIFGELSALTNEPTVSSVSAITDCLFLVISSSALFELMNFEPGLSKGIIRALCSRTQSMAAQIHDLLCDAKK